MMSDTGPDTNDKLKRRAKVILREMGSTITPVDPIAHLIYRMQRGLLSERTDLSYGVRYAAAIIIVAYQTGEASNFSASELTKLAHNWLFFFL
jgi:hypothetical protein